MMGYVLFFPVFIHCFSQFSEFNSCGLRICWWDGQIRIIEMENKRPNFQWEVEEDGKMKAEIFATSVVSWHIHIAIQLANISFNCNCLSFSSGQTVWLFVCIVHYWSIIGNDPFISLMLFLSKCNDQYLMTIIYKIHMLPSSRFGLLVDWIWFHIINEFNHLSLNWFHS